MTCLGGLQVSFKGDLANWIIPGKMVRGMGGAMVFFYFPLYFAFFVKDLVGSGSPVMVLMEHNSKNKPKVMQTCSLPITGADCVKKLVTDKGFF